jgi:hypothetical protein
LVAAICTTLLLTFTGPAACEERGGDEAGREKSKEASPKPFKKTLKLQGIAFDIHATNQGSLNQLTITPRGLERDNTAIRKEIEGSVTDAEIADLNGDGSPEIYIYMTSPGSGAYGSVIAYSANRKKSLSPIHLPDLSKDKKRSKGYMGHDQFSIVENVLARRFRLYKDGDSNASPTGKTRQIQYKLTAGEAGWVLRIDKTIEF